MMKKFFKIATMCSLVLSLSTAYPAYATEPSSTNDVTEHNTANVVVKGDINNDAETLYAVDIHHDSRLTFHYQAINDYDPDTLRYTYGVSERGKGLIGADAEDTAAKVSTAARDYTDPIPNTESDTFDGQAHDSDTNPQGAWYGFDGVTNRIVVVNRSINGIKMTATSSTEGVQLDNTYDSTVTINLYLNGDNIEDDVNDTDPEHTEVTTPAYQKRILDLTGGKTIKRDGEADFVSGELYQADATTPNYTENFKSLLNYSQAFSTKENDTTGGRFSANPEQVVDAEHELAAGNINKSQYSAVIQASDSEADPPVVANNFVNIAGHSKNGDNHRVGYALVYFDITGRPFDVDDPTVYQAQSLVSADGATALDAGIPVSTKIGTITLSFSHNLS